MLHLQATTKGTRSGQAVGLAVTKKGGKEGEEIRRKEILICVKRNLVECDRRNNSPREIKGKTCLGGGQLEGKAEKGTDDLPMQQGAQRGDFS